MMADCVPWLRELAKKGGKGVVNNVDARALGRVADELERTRKLRLRDIATIERLEKDVAAVIRIATKMKINSAQWGG